MCERDCLCKTCAEYGCGDCECCLDGIDQCRNGGVHDCVGYKEREEETS